MRNTFINPEAIKIHGAKFQDIRTNVEQRIEQKGITLKEFAADARWHYSALHKVLYGNESISLISICRLATALDVDIGYLLINHIEQSQKKI
ncbi:MAG: helix-turn-helix domain-containing protein [Breznakia sp.]